MIIDVKFKLAPSKRVFSRMKLNLLFDNQLVKSLFVGLPYHFARREELPIRSILSLRQIASGMHTIKVEIAGQWPLAGPPDVKESTIDYYPIVKEPIIKTIPEFKRIEGPAVAVVTEEAKKLYEEMRERWKRELMARRER